MFIELTPRVQKIRNLRDD